MSKHNIKSLLTFGASTSLVIAGTISCAHEYTTSAMVITFGALAYCMIWIVANREAGL